MSSAVIAYLAASALWSLAIAAWACAPDTSTIFFVFDELMNADSEPKVEADERPCTIYTSLLAQLQGQSCCKMDVLNAHAEETCYIYEACT